MPRPLTKVYVGLTPAQARAVADFIDRTVADGDADLDYQQLRLLVSASQRIKAAQEMQLSAGER